MAERNWKNYNEQLVKRGEFYISLDFLENWKTELSGMNKGKRGRPFIFPHTFMRFLAFLHIAFLPYRQMEGFLRKLSGYIPALNAADYSTICKRMNTVDMEFPLQHIPDGVVVAVDSSGMKVSSRGEWMRHKWRVRKGWIKVHIAVDVKTKQLISLEITDEHTHDGTMLKPLVEHSRKKGNGNVTRVLADGAYDSRENFTYLATLGIQAGIKTRKNATTHVRGCPSRARCVKQMRALGYDGWRNTHGYGRRWAAETYFSGVKRTFGETTRSRSLEGMFREVKMKFMFYNMLINL
jgi:IS5 family transposase